jgi:type IV pilus assembly protein PilM
MASSNDSWGIEVGSNAIKAMRLTRSGASGEPELAEYDIIPFDEVLTSPEVNVDAAIHQKLELFLSRHDVEGSELVASVPGHMAFARFAKLPPVSAKQVPNVVKYEAQQQIPFPIEQVEWDYQVFQQGQASQLGVGIFAMNKERVGQALNHYQQFDLELSALTLSPLAVYNAFQYDSANQPQQEGTIYMDIGAMSTDVIIVENGGIWLRTLPIGGNHFTEALVRAFKLSYPKAEKLKREAGTSKYARQIFQAMRPVFADLVQEIQRSLGYYQSLHRESDLKRVVGVGSTFRLPGLRKFLKQQLQMEVERLNGFQRIEAGGAQESEFADQSMNLATAYGLALQGLELETVTANLMPAHTLQARLWQAKQPWFAAAAACLLIAAMLVGGRYFLFSSSWSSARAETDRVVQAAVNSAREAEREWEDIDLTSPRTEINNLRRLLDYRTLWPGLIEDVAGANRAVLEASDSQQNEVYIARVQSTYDPAPNPGGGDSAGSARGAARGPAGARPGGAGPTAGGADATGQARGADEQGATPFGRHVNIETYFDPQQGVGPPRLTVTIKGTTAIDNANTVLSDAFIKALTQQAGQNARPYTTVSATLSSLSAGYEPQPTRLQLGEGGEDGQGGGPPPGAGLEAGPSREVGPEGDQQRTYSAEIGELEQYLPNAEAFGGADQVRDFTIEWTIELKRPVAARHPDRAGEDTPAEPEDQQSPDDAAQPRQARPDEAANQPANANAAGSSPQARDEEATS